MFSRKPSAGAWPKTQRVSATFAPSGRRFDDVIVCASPWRRARGLLFRGPSDQALLWPCGSVHSFFMSRPIDVIYLSDEGDVVKIVHGLVPWRTSVGGRGAFAVLEVTAGSARDLGTNERVSFDVQAQAKGRA